MKINKLEETIDKMEEKQSISDLLMVQQREKMEETQEYIKELRNTFSLEIEQALDKEKRQHQQSMNELLEKNNLFMQTMLSEFQTVKTKNMELNDENSQLRKQVTQQQSTPQPNKDHTQKDVDKPPVTTAFSTVFHAPTNHNEASMLSKDAKKSVSMTHSG